MRTRPRFLAIAALMLIGLSQQSAGTDFICKIRASGGDYTNLSTWEAAINSDLTISASKVFSASGTAGGGIEDGEACTGQASAATGICKHLLADGSQVYIIVSSGTFQNGETVVQASDSGRTVTLSSAGEQVGIIVAECYNDWPSGLTDSVTIDGSTNDASHYLKICTPLSERHDGTRGSGFHLVAPAGKSAISIRDNFTRIIGIEMNGNNTSASIISVGSYRAAGNYGTRCLVEKCFAYDAQYRGIDAGDFARATIRNNFVAGINHSTYGAIELRPATASSFHKVYNNTIINSACGINHSTTGEEHSYVFNNVVWNSNTGKGFVNIPANDARADHNCSKDDTAPGSHSIHGDTDGKTPGFISSVDGSENMHIIKTSDMINAGTNLTLAAYSPFEDDIDEHKRVDPWDIGADQIPPPGGTVVIFK